jgi:hypothetical protein
LCQNLVNIRFRMRRRERRCGARIGGWGDVSIPSSFLVIFPMFKDPNHFLFPYINLSPNSFLKCFLISLKYYYYFLFYSFNFFSLSSHFVFSLSPTAASLSLSASLILPLSDSDPSISTESAKTALSFISTFFSHSIASNLTPTLYPNTILRFRSIKNNLSHC